jgi:hypothetical protein
MRHRIRSHLSYANVMATLAVFIALGGTAMASVIITSNSQVAQNTIAGHNPPSGKHPNIIAGSVNVTDLAPTVRSGCPTGMTLVGKRHDLCVDSTDRATVKSWSVSAAICRDAGLRLPSVAEALEAHAVLDAGGGNYWTDDIWITTHQWDSVYRGAAVASPGIDAFLRQDLASLRCVATPSEA